MNQVTLVVIPLFTRVDLSTGNGWALSLHTPLLWGEWLTFITHGREAEGYDY